MTGKSWDLPLERKSDVHVAFSHWVTFVNSLTRHKVRRLHSDNGTEFNSAEMRTVCADNKITQTYSSAYTPQQNPRAERLIGTLTRLANAALRCCNGPVELWWFCRANAGHVVNTMGTGNGELPPDEAFFQQQPDATLLLPFGCKVFAWRDARFADDPKWNSSGIWGTYIGTGLNHGRRACAILTEKGQVIYTVHITADQTYFPYRAPGDRRLTGEFWSPDLDPVVNAGSFDDVYTAAFTPPAVEGGVQDDEDDLSAFIDSIAVNGSTTGNVIGIMYGTLADREMYGAQSSNELPHFNLDEAQAHDARDGLDQADSVNRLGIQVSADSGDGDACAKDDVQHEADFNPLCKDGTTAREHIGKRVEKTFSGKVYHGTIKHFKKSETAAWPTFRVFWDEDKSSTFHTWVATRKMINDARGSQGLDEAMAAYDVMRATEAALIAQGHADWSAGDQGEEAAFLADDIVDDLRSPDEAGVSDIDRMPDVVPTRREMLQQPDRDEFIAAEGVEIQNLEDHHVMEWIDIPPGTRLLRSKFTYKRKRNSAGKIEKHKARLVACGYGQIYGVQYTDTFAPVATPQSFRIMMTCALMHKLNVWQMDVTGAFINSDLKERIIMAPPSGFKVDPKNEGKAILLKKSLYGLKQSAYEWHALLSRVLQDDLGYTPVDGSGCFFKIWNGDDEISLLSVHVDDVAHAFSQDWLNKRLISKLESLWGCSNVSPLHFHLGMHIDYRPGVHCRISQRAYFEKVLKRFNYERMSAKSTPLDPAVKLSAEDCPKIPNEEDKKLYASILGSVLYGAVSTRPDLSNAMTVLGRYMANPGPSHMTAIRRVLRYIVGTLDYGLEYRNERWTPSGLDYSIAASELINFTDSDWAGDKDKSLSTTGTVTYLAGGPISWRAQLHKGQDLSSAEAEYKALGNGAKDVMYCRNVLKELDFYPVLQETKMLCDNNAAIAIASGPGINSRTKHIALRYHFVRQLVSSKEVKPTKVGTKDNVADLLTKATDVETFRRLVQHLVKAPSVQRDGATHSSKGACENKLDS